MELSFIIRFASAAVQACRDMGGFLPSVLIAMMCLETGYGKGSGCAVLMLWFNLLGMKADLHKFFTSKYWGGDARSKTTPEYYGHWTTIDDAFCVYTSAYQCCMDFLSFMRDGIVDGKNYKYRDLMSCTDPATIAKALQVRGYATDPDYDDKLMDIIKKYNLTKFDGPNVPTAPFIADLIDINASQVQYHNANSHEYLAIHYLGVDGENPNLYGGGYGGHFYISKTGACSEAALVTDKIWHVGTSSGFKYIHPSARNENTIGIEIATYSDGEGDNKKWFFTEESQQAAAKLAAWIMFVLDMPDDHLLRHGDITTKHCPAPYIDFEGQGTNWTWARFKEEVKMAKNEYVPLMPGSTGERVKWWQQGLLDLGFADCSFYITNFVDGDYGTNTTNFTARFQRYYGLTVDGCAGPASQAVMERELAKINTTKFNFSAEHFIECGLKVGKIYQEKGYIWGSADIAPWLQPEVLKSSCDRGQVHAFKEAGIDLGNLEAKGLAAKLLALGGTKIKDVADVRAGDIVFLNSWHVFAAASGRDANGNYLRIDFGSTPRMQNGQPYLEPIVNFQFAVRPPYEGAEPEPEPEEERVRTKYSLVIEQIRQGDFCPSVGILQSRLNSLGYHYVVVDCDFGNNTDAAFREWQEARIAEGKDVGNSQGEADGICGRASWSELLGIEVETIE